MVTAAFTAFNWTNVVATVGATTPFTTFEAEAGTLGGGATVVSLTSPPTTEFSSPQLEASGHAYVSLTGLGQSITWTNNTNVSFSGINVRFSIPDSASGGGTTATLDLYVDGSFRQALTLSSAQEWLYETASDYDSSNQSPSYGYPHKFWDDIHVLIKGDAIDPGSTIELRQDSTNTAAFYWIDCVDLEPVPAALTQPVNTLSIENYGAMPNNPAVDNTAAIQSCINAAQTAGKIVWVPAGTFYINGSAALRASGITIEGAGPWYSIIYRNVALPATTVYTIIYPTSCVMQNLCFDANATGRAVVDGNGGGLTATGSNWVINNVWIQHTDAGVWGDGDTGTVENSRMFDTWGDGINLNNGNGAAGNDTGNNLTAINNFVRGAGDDGLAINATTGASTQMNNIKLINNTSIASYWANQIGIYGGQNDTVANNLLTDSVKEDGLNIGCYGSAGSALQSGLFTQNTLLRCGSFGFGKAQSALKIGTTNETNSIDSSGIISNTVSNSMFEALHVYKNTGNISVNDNVIAVPGATGLLIDSNATGDGTFTNNIVSTLGSGQVAFLNNSGSFVQSSLGQRVTGAIEASSFNSQSGSIGTQACSEGGLNLDNIANSSYTVYNNVDLNDVTEFTARLASYLPTDQNAGNIAIYLDSPTNGTLIGTCSFMGTGGWQSWATVNCNLSGATGYHNVYLVYTGPMNLEWFAFQGNDGGLIEAASYNSQVGGVGTQSSSEGGLNIDGLTSGSYTVYNNVNLNGVTTLAVREACWGSGTSVQIFLDSPTGTPLVTCPLAATGGTQIWTTQTCALNGVSGYHNIYLVNTSGHDHNIEWLAFYGGNGAIEGSSYNSVGGAIGTQNCSEGGLNLDNVTTGDYAVYNNIDLNSVTSFSARIASAVTAGQSAGSVAVHLDSPTGTLVGTLATLGTGGWQNWSTQSCALTGASGYHNIYLVFAGSGSLPNLEWLSFTRTTNVIEASSYNNISGAIGTQGSSEGGLNLDNVTTGNYAVYSNVNLTGMTTLAVRTACANSTGGTITVRADSPTGTVIGTITAPYTGGWQNWATQTCNLSGASGYHNVYVAFTGTGSLPNVEWLKFQY